MKMEFYEQEAILDGAPEGLRRLSERWNSVCRDVAGKEARMVITDFSNHPVMGKFAMAEIMSNPAVVGGRPALVLWVKDLDKGLDPFLACRELSTWIAVAEGFPGYENERTLILGPLCSAVLRNPRAMSIMEEERVDGYLAGFRKRCQAAVERVRDNPPMKNSAAGGGSGLLCLDAVNLFPDLRDMVMALPQEKCGRAKKVFREGERIMDKHGRCGTPEEASRAGMALVRATGCSGWKKHDARKMLLDAVNRSG